MDLGIRFGVEGLPLSDWNISLIIVGATLLIALRMLQKTLDTASRKHVFELVLKLPLGSEFRLISGKTSAEVEIARRAS